MYCPKCGKENKDDAKFCYACGAPLIPAQHQQNNASHRSSHVQPVGMDHSSGKKTLISSAIVLIGTILLFISAFSPVYKVSFWGFNGSYNYFSIGKLLDELDSSDSTAEFVLLGMLFMALAVILIILKLTHKRIAGIVVSIISLVISIILLIALNDSVSDSFGMLSLGSSAYLSLFGSIIAAFGNIIKM